MCVCVGVCLFACACLCGCAALMDSLYVWCALLQLSSDRADQRSGLLRQSGIRAQSSLACTAQAQGSQKAGTDLAAKTWPWPAWHGLWEVTRICAQACEGEHGVGQYWCNEAPLCIAAAAAAAGMVMPSHHTRTHTHMRTHTHRNIRTHTHTGHIHAKRTWANKHINKHARTHSSACTHAPTLWAPTLWKDRTLCQT